MDLLSLSTKHQELVNEQCVCISMTLPVTSAAYQRRSCLCRLKTYLRNRSGDAGTSSLGVLAVNSIRTHIDVNAVMDRFTTDHSHRRIALL